MRYTSLAESVAEEVGIPLQLYKKNGAISPYRVIVNVDREYCFTEEESLSHFLIGVRATGLVKIENAPAEEKKEKSSLMIVALELGEHVRKVMIERSYNDLTFWSVGYIENKSDNGLDLEAGLSEEITFSCYEPAEIAFKNYKV